MVLRRGEVTREDFDLTTELKVNWPREEIQNLAFRAFVLCQSKLLSRRLEASGLSVFTVAKLPSQLS